MKHTDEEYRMMAAKIEELKAKYDQLLADMNRRYEYVRELEVEVERLKKELNRRPSDESL